MGSAVSDLQITDDDTRDEAPAPRPRVVYAEPPFLLAVPVEEEEGGFRIRVLGSDRVAQLDASVDPEVVREAMRGGARVVVETAPDLRIVGALATTRSLTIDREGNVEAEVGRLRITARTEALIQTTAAFIHLDGRKLEQFAGEIRTRARDAVRLLGAVIRLN